MESAFRSSAESTKCHGEEIIQSRDLVDFPRRAGEDSGCIFDLSKIVLT